MHMHKDAFFDTLPRVVKSLKPGGYFFLKTGVGEARNVDDRLSASIK